jgi:hypothetical protein
LTEISGLPTKNKARLAVRLALKRMKIMQNLVRPAQLTSPQTFPRLTRGMSRLLAFREDAELIDARLKGGMSAFTESQKLECLAEPVDG